MMDHIAMDGHLDLCIFVYETYGVHPGQRGANGAMANDAFPVVNWLETKVGIKAKLPDYDIVYSDSEEDSDE